MKKIALVLSFLFSIIFAFSFAPSALAQNQYKANKNAFTIESLSPFVVQNSAIDINIRSLSNNGKFRIEVLKPTNTQSELYNFTSNLGTGKVRDSLELDLVSTSTNSDSTFNFNAQIPVNSDPETSLLLNGAGIFPIAITQIASNKDLTTKYSFVTNIPSISSNGSAYSHKLKLVPLLEYNPSINPESLQNKRNLESTTRKILEAQSLINGIISQGYKTSVLLSPRTLEIYNELKKLNPSQVQQNTLFPINAGEKVEYISDTYVPVDISELEKNGLSEKYADLMAQGRTIITEQGYISPSRTLITKSITDTSIDMIAKSGIDNVIVSDLTLNKDERPIFGPSFFQNKNSKIKLASANSQIIDNIPDGVDSSTISNYLIAALSVVTLESPSLERGYILPINISKISKAQIIGFLNTIGNNPLIESISTEDFFNTLNENRTVSKKLAKYKGPRKISKYLSGEDIKYIDKTSTAIKSMFNKSSLPYLQAKWINSSALSRSDLASEDKITRQTIDNDLKDTSKKIALPQKRTLTITSKQSTIPVTIKNISNETIRVKIDIKSEKLSFPKGSKFDASLKSENTTIKIPVSAKTTGSFPVQIRVLTPENSVVVVQQNATVRSTAFSGVGIFIALGAIIFLAIWWASHIRKTKKQPLANVIEIKKENAG